ncbi:hypothetical protein FA09DRAFT_97832 [Tilletiopsis washingtonensis]|uniref:Uncharacterized protein n=1 Tax=Tilletiopsis washingtonensis TaxID=58919 RepID=A0A316Z7X7_9BASI|nr:hypothetical protein FA09DRAFT_97832 [Tilletiopsis washingtonensis]PWN96273.1 hypothetical protein FA09DRAFT_97832 [Tilletiopsis washingtonensis]
MLPPHPASAPCWRLHLCMSCMCSGRLARICQTCRRACDDGTSTGPPSVCFRSRLCSSECGAPHGLDCQADCVRDAALLLRGSSSSLAPVRCACRPLSIAAAAERTQSMAAHAFRTAGEHPRLVRDESRARQTTPNVEHAARATQHAGLELLSLAAASA